MKDLQNLNYIFVKQFYLSLLKAEKLKLGKNNINNFKILKYCLKRIRFNIKNNFSLILNKKFKKLRKRIKIFEQIIDKFLSFEILIKNFYNIKENLTSDYKNFEDILLTIQHSFYFQRINLLKNYDYLELKKGLVDFIWRIKNSRITKKDLKKVFLKFEKKMSGFYTIVNIIKENCNNENIKLLRKSFIQIRYFIEYFFFIFKIKYTDSVKLANFNNILSRIKNIDLIIEELTKIANETNKSNVLGSIAELKDYHIIKKKNCIEILNKEIFEKDFLKKLTRIIDGIKENFVIF
ncbi:MAG TPA: hypothetical protein PLE45_04090 [Spirochaetota bacterium]|nr:hypothetical protein [Spirochaetota bacterium]HOL56388.1 hypothetical protein [Spirochaetota bacterium]HPP04628.1 hypothetical protein [Spirochaetota bacterium]